jgi:hypothetical protein
MGNGSQSFGRHGVTSDVELGVPREVFKVDGVVLVTQNMGERDLGVKEEKSVDDLHLDVNFRGEKFPGLDVLGAEGRFDAVEQAFIVTHEDDGRESDRKREESEDMECQTEVGEKAVAFSPEGSGSVTVGLATSLRENGIVRGDDGTVGTHRVDCAPV